MPTRELGDSLRSFLQPVSVRLPDARHRAVVELMAQGIIASGSPIITQIARGASHVEETVWPTCRRAYRLLANRRFDFRTLRKGLYAVAQRAVEAERPDYLVVAVDPVNFEKPYTRDWEGVSIVMKSTPPSLDGKKRLTRGYPAITATIVNMRQPATTYANWFSYTTADFVSQNLEIWRALRSSCHLFPGYRVRFVGDSGLDDEKIFAQVDKLEAEFVFRACQNRRIEVYNGRMDRWESELLFDLALTVPLEFTEEVLFTHARRVRRAHIGFGWFMIRLAETQQVLWVLVAHDPQLDRDLVLLTNVPLNNPHDVRRVYADWRLRSRIEHDYRFEQEAGLDVEDMRVATLERMRRLFILILLSAQFVFYIAHTWSRVAVICLRQLGGKLGLRGDRDGPYILLRGIGAVWLSAATNAFLLRHPFPRDT